MLTPSVLPLLPLLLAANAPLTVSVLPFDNRTGSQQYDVLEKGLSDMLITDLAAAEGLTVVERTRLADVMAELKLQRTSLFDPATVQKVGGLVGASHVVTGSLLKVDPELRLDVRLVEVKTAKVLYGANVAGKSDRLFELEQELVQRFLDGLGRKGVLAARSGPAKVETLLAYSQALAQADRGELKEASTALAAVMKSDQDFRLAKERYTDVLRRLREAGARRDEVLSTGEKELVDRIEKALASPPDFARAKAPALRVHFGYRAMLANVHLARLRRLLGPDDLPNNPKLMVWVKKARREAARPLLTAYFEEATRLLDEMDSAAQNRDWKQWYGIGKTPDHDRAAELGIGEYSDVMHTGADGVVELADFVFTGELRIVNTLRKMSPPPALIEPRLVEPALKLYARAGELVKAQYQPDERPAHDGAIALSHGQALYLLGRKEAAMARWQQSLDESPTGPQYKEIEKRVERALGIDENWKALDRQVCDQGLMDAWASGVHRLLTYDVEALFKRAEKIPALCGKKPAQPFYPAMGFQQIGYAAAIRGDCATYVRAVARAKQVTPEIGQMLESYASACFE